MSRPATSSRPTLETDRLRLRPFTHADAPGVQRLAGDEEIAAMTLSIPHPYPDGVAEQWIDTHQGQWERGEGVQLAIERRDDGALVGTIGLSVDKQHSRAELGYFVGVPYWGNGYATEAARAVVDYAFDQLQVNRVYALHFVGNPASGRVLEKVGMQLEGTLREHHHRWEAFRDSRVYGLLRRERA